MKRILSAVFSIFIIAACAMIFSCSRSTSSDKSFQIDYEKYVLDNGLEVILHEDHSDPIVAISTFVHVGSHREKPGRTGFAHFFEHMLSNDSENVPRGAIRKLIPELGGQLNGFTSSDGTGFYEVVPKDAFEKILWIESDRLGFIINTITEAALEREKQVIKNEKRQIFDNVPYGHTFEISRANLYPADHPYHGTVIGSFPDLQAATLEDVKEFYDHYYGADNSTLVIAGDIDISESKRLVDRWFGEIRRGPEVVPLLPMPVTLSVTCSLYHEDNFARLPELHMFFPTVENYHPDYYALRVLAEVLARTKQAPLYKVIVEEKELAPEVEVYQDSMELAGEFTIRVRANAGVDLDDVYTAIEESFARFEQDGFPENELKRVKAQMETELYNGISTVLDKALQLAEYNAYTGDPGYVSVESHGMHAVTHEDVMDVYRRYIKDQLYLITSFVPKGQTDLIVTGAKKAEIYEEIITSSSTEEQVSQGEEAVYEKTPTKQNRSEPPLGDPPLLTMPAVWTDKLENGLEIYGIEHKEVPLVVLDLTLRGGFWLDPLEKAGIANLLAELMMQGTRNRTPAELEEAIGLLGANISVEAFQEEIRISVNTLTRNFDATLALMEEILFEPRWDKTEYERLKRELETRLKDGEANMSNISRVAWSRLLYGEKHIFGLPRIGTLETSARITMDDLKAYYEDNFSPSAATIHVVGDVSRDRVTKALSNLNNRWKLKEITFPDYSLPKENKGGQIFFVDVPGAKQSIVMICRLTVSAKDHDHNNLAYAHQILGGDMSGRLHQLLRIEKGYTYGAFSYLGSTLEVSPFGLYAYVRPNVTLESLQLMRDLLENYRATFTKKEMEITKNKMIKANTRAYESLEAKLGLLQRMSKLNLPRDFLEKEQQELLAMKLEDFHRVIDLYMDEDTMFYLIVGSKTQLSRIAELGYGSARVLDIYGREIN